MNTSKEQVGKRVEIIRKKTGLTGLLFGEKIGVSKNAFSRYKNGEVFPRAEALVKIAELGNVSLEWLLTGRELRPQNNGQIVSTIAPGSEKTVARIREQSNRPTVKIPHLKWIVEWMDLYFADNEEQALLFYEQLKDIKPSFVDFIKNEKKPTDKDHQNRPVDRIQNGE